MEIVINTEKLNFVIDVNEDKHARLVWFSALPWDRSRCFTDHKYHNVLELHCLGEDIDDHHGSRHTYMSPGVELRYVNHEISDEQGGRLLTLSLKNGNLSVRQHYRFRNNSSVVQCWNDIENFGDKPITVLYDSSFVCYNICGGNETDWENNLELCIPNNTWHGEMQWRRNSLWELGLNRLGRSCLKKLSFSNTGSWSSGEYLPMAVLENKDANSALFWQIEHNGSWYFETSATKEGGPYIQVGGPNFDEHHFEKRLGKGDAFTSVRVAAGVCRGGFEEAIRELTAYRRLIRRPNRDDEELPVIFNDYMNCLMGDPTEERELPMIDAAADAGCDYYVIDAGWFSDVDGGDDDWWPILGVYEESKKRFPHGLKYVSDYIRSKKMIPGLWLELESMGCLCPEADSMPDDWFFQQEGHRIRQHGRYQLDFRNRQVCKRADDIVEKVVREYGFSYIKLDYNINSGVGTDYNADSMGSGLLEHNRAFLNWIDSVLRRFPELVIENCASGGQRMDYAMLSRLSIQSTSDQTDYRRYSAISAMSATGATPEQAAVWSYPKKDSSEEETVYNMIKAMLGRIHQSGFLHTIDPCNSARIKEAIDCYKNIRKDIREALPLYPLGLIYLNSPWAVQCLQKENTIYLSVWRRETEENTLEIPFPQISKNSHAECIYPSGLSVKSEWNADSNLLTVTLPQKNTARFFRIISEPYKDENREKIYGT